MPQFDLSIALATLFVLFLLFIPPILIWKKKVRNGKLLQLIYALFLIWTSRFLVGIFSEISTNNGLTSFEAFFDSLVHTLQTFSMDEDYTTYTVAGKNFLSDLGLPILASVYGIVISILNVYAPVLGGALLLDILTGVFPYLKLSLMARRHKFVFSELNDESITLAEDICRSGHYRELIKMDRFDRKPLIVFSDAYLDDESEVSSELHLRAKALGAVCIKSDLICLSLKRSKSVSYFLIDKNADSNINMLSHMLEYGAEKSVLWPVGPDQQEPVTRIYVFGLDETANILLKQICAKYKSSSEGVLVRRIADQMNASINLLYEYPLFLPLLSKPAEQRQDLHVTILGSGSLAEEAFKTVFWCGQMHQVRLHINVVADDASTLKQTFTEKYPELLESCKAGSPVLRVRPFGPEQEFNDPYCASLEFHDVDDTACVSAYPGTVLKETDYFIIALETDILNLQAATSLKVILTRNAMQTGDLLHPVIAPAVMNSQLASAVLNLKPNRYEPYIVPFASLENRFSCKNVFMTSFIEQALSTENLYRKANQKKDQDDGYTNLSNNARAVHAPYKLFGFGLIREVDLQKDISIRYLVAGHRPLSQEEEHQMAWIEHRRWNAFLRSQGFVCPSKEQYDAFFKLRNETRCIPLKLHPCLVESQVIPAPLPDRKNYDKSQYDYLDYVTMYTYHLKAQHAGKVENAKDLRSADYKQYDYYREYDPAVTSLLQ